jgi:hypothetical protein
MDTKTVEDLELIRSYLAIIRKDIESIRTVVTGNRELGIASINVQQAVAAISAVLKPEPKVYTDVDSEFVAGLNSGTDS